MFQQDDIDLFELFSTWEKIVLFLTVYSTGNEGFLDSVLGMRRGNSATKCLKLLQQLDTAGLSASTTMHMPDLLLSQQHQQHVVIYSTVVTTASAACRDIPYCCHNSINSMSWYTVQYCCHNSINSMSWYTVQYCCHNSINSMSWYTVLLSQQHQQHVVIYSTVVTTASTACRDIQCCCHNSINSMSWYTVMLSQQRQQHVVTYSTVVTTYSCWCHWTKCCGYTYCSHSMLQYSTYYIDIATVYATLLSGYNHSMQQYWVDIATVCNSIMWI